jgi:hypothetical protein
MEIPPLLRPAYWFSSNPPPLLPAIDRTIVVVFGIFLFVGIFGRIIALRHGWEKMMKRAIVRASHSLIVLGIFGLVLYGLSFERVPVLSARFGYILWFGLFVWYAWRIFKFVYREIPAIEKKRAEREAMDKWIPKNGK